MLHRQSGIWYWADGILSCYIKFSDILICYVLIRADINYLKQIILLFDSKSCCLYNCSSGNKSFSHTHFICYKHTILIMPEQIIHSLEDWSSALCTSISIHRLTGEPKWRRWATPFGEIPEKTTNKSASIRRTAAGAAKRGLMTLMDQPR